MLTDLLKRNENPEGEGHCCEAEWIADVEDGLYGADGDADVGGGWVGDGVEAVVVEGATRPCSVRVAVECGVVFYREDERGREWVGEIISISAWCSVMVLLLLLLLLLILLLLLLLLLLLFVYLPVVNFEVCFSLESFIIFFLRSE